MKRILSCFLAIILLLSVFTLVKPVKAAGDKVLNIHAIYLKNPDGSAGEGDAVLLESNGHYLLMDCGMGDYPYSSVSNMDKIDVTDSLMAYLDSIGIGDAPLDIYISHIHNDHFSGMYNIIMSKKYNIQTIYAPAEKISKAGGSNDYAEFIYNNVITNNKNRYGNAFKGIEVVYLSPSTIICSGETVTDNFKFGDATVKIIGPIRLCTEALVKAEYPKYSVDTDKIENNNSLCAVVTCGKAKYLTMGDALDFEENDLIKKYKSTSTLKADVFKEDHHGYSQSGSFATNTEELIACIKPKYAFCQNKAAQTNKWVPWAVTRYGENTDIYKTAKTIVYNLSTSSDGVKTVKKSFCGHSLSCKTITATKISGDMANHTLKVKCTACGNTKTVTEGHLWNSNGKCTLCGYQCPHTYVNEKGETKNNYSSVDCCCLNCRMHCKHKAWWESSHKCQTCYLVCEHKSTSKSTIKATKTENGKIVTKCKNSECGITLSTKTIYHPSKYTLSTSTYIYDGKAKSPSIKIYDTKGNQLVKNTDYTVASPSGRTNVGKYTFKITFKGKYSGTATKTITIKPKGTSLTTLSPIKNGFKVVWAKQATQTTGYQIQAAANDSFTSDVHSYTFTDNSLTSERITKNLTAGKKYYVRIRTFKTVTVNGKSEKIYSSWSTVKSGTTKK